MLGTLADIVGILSFILTIILLVRSERLRNEIVSQKIDYRNQQTKIVDRLTELRSCLQNNEPLSVKTISGIRLELYQCDISFQHILSSRDKKILRKIKETTFKQARLFVRTLFQNGGIING